MKLDTGKTRQRVRGGGSDGADRYALRNKRPCEDIFKEIQDDLIPHHAVAEINIEELQGKDFLFGPNHGLCKGRQILRQLSTN